jgi:hypothetical protein
MPVSDNYKHGIGTKREALYEGPMIMYSNLLRT